MLPSGSGFDDCYLISHMIVPNKKRNNTNFDGKIDILTFRTNVNVNRKLSFQGYVELFSNQDIYFQDSYSEYLIGEQNYDSNTPYIKGTGKWLKNKLHVPDCRARCTFRAIGFTAAHSLKPAYKSESLLQGIPTHVSY